MTKIEILVTGPELLGKNVRATERVMEEIIERARNEIQILTYLFTPKASRIIRLLESAAERGILITIIVNSLNSQHPVVRKRLMRAAEKYSNFRVIDFSAQKGELHAKLIIVDRKWAVVGSANLSMGGIYTNYEIGLLIEGEEVWTLAGIVDRMTELAHK
jgi:phosphatidylserine/phosphatidylglycerophosphate/cardiolipin synthase-like enzyme